MAVTRGGVWPGNTTDMTVMAEVRSDLAGWQLNRTVWVLDLGFNSADNRQLLQWGGSGFIVAERLRGNEHDVAEARSRQGRYRRVDYQLEVKEITLGEGSGRNASSCAATMRSPAARPPSASVSSSCSPSESTDPTR